MTTWLSDWRVTALYLCAAIIAAAVVLAVRPSPAIETPIPPAAPAPYSQVSPAPENTPP
ncbi:hypothetical protein GCM10022221_68610 [Actinocorallia aurea]